LSEKHATADDKDDDFLNKSIENLFKRRGIIKIKHSDGK